MTIDPFGILSGGAFPKPTPTDSARRAQALSLGILNFTLPEGSSLIERMIYRIGLLGFQIFEWTKKKIGGA